MWVGSIAQQIVAAGDTRVLLIRPRETGALQPFALTVLLAPFDAKEGHEVGLDVPLDLARAAGARLQLIAMVPTVGKLSGRLFARIMFAIASGRRLVYARNQEFAARESR
jgi:hypothetical protein